MIRQTMTISLPADMVRQMDEARKRKQRTRSELIREALRLYFGSDRIPPVYSPTERERRAIRRGRAAIRKGRYYTPDEFRTWLMGSPHPETHKQKTSRRSARRSRTPAACSRRNRT